MQTITKTIEPVARLPEGQFIDVSMDYAGRLLLLMLINKTPVEHRPAQKLPDTEKQTYTYQVWQTKNEDSYELSLYTEITVDSEVYYAQRFTNGDILLVFTQYKYRNKEDCDKSGYIYSVDGQLKKRILLGDGIAQVHITKDDVIWISYSDQSLLADSGCDNFTNLGLAGLIAWNADGKKVYEFEPSNDLYKIIDCYALNVTLNMETYAYYFYNDDNYRGEFDLVKIKDKKINNYWHMPVSGSGSFIVSDIVGDDKAVFDSGYPPHNTLFYLVELQKEHQAQIMKQFAFEYKGENILQRERSSRCYPRARNDSFLVVKDKYLFVIPFTEFLS